MESVSDNTEQKLTLSRGCEVNQIDGTDEIQDVHLMPTDSGYVLEVLGKTGERRPRQAVRVQLKHRDFVDPVDVDLQSDADGQIQLGQLMNIASVTATLAGGSARSWPLGEDTLTRPDRIHVPAGEIIQVPAPVSMDEVSRSEVSLYETRQGSVVADHFDRIELKEGLLQIADLKPGDYALRLKQIPALIGIKVVEGKTYPGVVVGKHRHAEIRDIRPLVVKTITASDDQLQIQLGNTNKYTRVHVLATRYQPRFDAFNEFARVGGIPPWIQIQSLRRSAYMAGRKLGDEYQYILNRRYASKYPGNMLQRPSVLIRPWSTRETNNQVESLARGEDFSNVGTDADSQVDRGRAASRGEVIQP